MGKLLYIRQYNGKDRLERLPAIIVGDASTENGRDNAYIHKGQSKDKFSDILDCETGEIYEWPKIDLIETTDDFSRDYDVHEFLKTKGSHLVKWDGETNKGLYTTREAFIVKKGHTVGEVVDFIRKAIEGNLQKTNFGLRKYQEAPANEIIEKFKLFDEVLLQAAPRFGKSFVSLRIAKNLGKERILILTPFPDAKDSFKNVVDSHEMMGEYKFIDLSNKEKIDSTKKYIMFLSWQTFAGGNNSDLLKKCNPDFVITDEYHRQADTEKSKQILEQIIGNKNIKKLCLSATPYNDIMYGDFKDKPNQIVTFDLIDMLSATKGTIEAFPQMNFYFPENCENVYLKLKQKFNFEDADKFTLDKMIADNKHPEYAAAYWEHYFTAPINELTGLPSRKILFSQLNKKPNHILIYVPDGSADINYKAINDLSTNPSSCINGYAVKQVSAENNEVEIRKFENDVNIFQEENEKTIVISKGKGTTGVTLKRLDCVIIAKKIQSTELFVQIACRPITPFAGKYSVSVFCMDSELRLTLANATNVGNNTAHSEAEKRLKRFFSLINAYYHTDNGFEEESAENLLSFIKDIKIDTPCECYRDMQDFVMPDLSKDIIAALKEIKVEDHNKRWSVILGRGGNEGAKTAQIEKKKGNKTKKEESIEDLRKKIMQLFTNIDWIIFLNNYETAEDLKKHFFSENTLLDECAKMIIDENFTLFDNMCYKIKNTPADVLKHNLSSRSKTDKVETKELIDEIFSKADMLDTCDTDVKVMDPCAGRGFFAEEIHNRLMKNKNFIKKYPDKNERSKWIKKENIFLNDIDDTFCYILNKMEYKNVTNLDAISEEFDKMLDDKKFDLTIGNPPYEGKGHPLYLQILEKCNKHSNKTIWICPSQWVKNYKDSSFIENIKNNTCKNLISHQYVGNPFNNAVLANETCIFEFGINDKYENYNDIRLERFKNPQLAKSIIKKFENFKVHINEYDDLDNSSCKTGYYVNASKIRGHFHGSKPCWDWTTLFGNKQRINFNFIQSKEYNHWKFKTVDECKNFVLACETDILMFAYYICKQNVNCFPGYFILIPWLGDYTHEWTEDMIIKELGLTDEEVSYIHEEMKPFGWKTRKECKDSK